VTLKAKHESEIGGKDNDTNMIRQRADILLGVVWITSAAGRWAVNLTNESHMFIKSC
jgi:hypothetical protein